MPTTAQPVRPLEGDAVVVHPSRISTPLISVVLPTYNRVGMLRAAIESVLAQTETRFELIVVDDGSSDGTSELVAEFAKRDERVGLIRQTNLRLPRALNNGFRAARGELRTWTSDDNRYFPDAFALLSRALLDDPQLALVHAEMLSRTRDGALYVPTKNPTDHWHSNKVGAAFMYRAVLADRAGEYDPEIFLGEDYDYWLRLGLVGGVRHLPFIVYEYAFHEGSLTSSRRKAHIEALEKIARKHLELGSATPRQISRLATTVAGNYRRYGYRRDALRMAWFAWRLSPASPLALKSVTLAFVAAIIFRHPAAERRLRAAMGKELN
jgi:glycosyltransferase involved in cell wall biosynthesis